MPDISTKWRSWRKNKDGWLFSSLISEREALPCYLVLTVIVHFFSMPLAVFTVITALPGASAVTTPAALTLQTAGLELVNFSV